jgi:protein-disulfide isomerase
MISSKRAIAVFVLFLTTSLMYCASQNAGDSGTADALAASIGGESITRDELLSRLETDNYDLVRDKLEQMVTERLTAMEAEERGMEPEELIEAEVDAKVGEPTDEEIEEFYNRHVDVARKYGGIEGLRDRIAATIKNQRSAELREQFIRTLKAERGYRMLIEPARFELAIGADDPVRGPENAPVTIVEYADFQCPYCRNVHVTIEQLLLEYADQVRYVYRDYPLPNHMRALPAAQAARCAAEQGKFWEYFEHLMMMNGDLGDEDLLRRAEAVGLDAGEFSGCVESGRHKELVDQHFKSGQAAGVTGTPTFFINGRRVAGAKSYEQLKTVIEEELARSASTPIVGG